MDIFVEKRNIPVMKEFDVIIAGGGIAGISAALSAKREGADVLLLEKSCVLGGLATLGLVNWYEPLCDGIGNVVTTGIAEELLKLAIKYGYDNLDSRWKNDSTNKKHIKRRYSTFFNPSIFSLALNNLLIKENISIMYDTLCSYPVMEYEKVRGIIIENKDGRKYYPTKVLVDATGDADLIYRAGVPCREGKNYLTYYGHGCNEKTLEKAYKSKDMFELNAGIFHVGADMNGRGQPVGVPVYSGISADVVNEYIRTGQSLLFEKIKLGKKDEQCLYSLPNMPQLRKTRCMIGEATFLAEDGRHFENSVGMIGDFRYRGKHYEIPMSTLYNKKFPNILAAGRVISADREGWETARVIPSAALTGQASGVLAAKAAKDGVVISEVDYRFVQERLLSNRVNLFI